jgi:hypothetical protein
MPRQKQSHIVFACVESSPELGQQRTKQCGRLRQVKARNLAVATGEAVKTVQAALEMEVDGQMSLESLLEFEQRDVVTRVQLHALCPESLGTSR